MPAPKTTTWDLDPHTHAKHVILQRYLQAWFPIMTKYNGRVIVLDGFAGPGEYSEGEPGSPLIAIHTWLEHAYSPMQQQEVLFLFIERDHQRCAHLQQLLATRYPAQQVRYQIFEGTFDETLSGLLGALEQEQLRLAPTFAFIDPFGFSQTPMSIIAKLMSHPKCEVLITFMHEEINRFLTFDNEEIARHYDALFGTTTWRDIAGQATNSKDRAQRIHDLYQTQLRNLVGAPYIRSFRMRNKSNATDYFLFFATTSLQGMEKMKDAMWKVDPSGAYDFSDFTNPDQLLLFTPEPDFTLLKKMLQTQFQGKTVSLQEIEAFVIGETPYRTSGYKTAVLKPMEYAQPPQIKIMAASEKRKRGTYGDETMRIQFL
jgi:three-Cys-motif partner protein